MLYNTAYTVETVDTVNTVDTANTVDTVDTVYIVGIVFIVNNIQNACLYTLQGKVAVLLEENGISQWTKIGITSLWEDPEDKLLTPG